MSKDSQKKQKRKQRKDKQRKDKRKKSAQYKADKWKKAHTEAFGTTAYFWPEFYRLLTFETLPNFSEGIDFTGVDLFLSTFPSQEDRSLRTNGTLVTSLRIDSCSEIHRAQTSKLTKYYRCRANLAELILEGSLYGDWYREQYHSSETVEGEEWQETKFEFTIRAQKSSASSAKKSNKYMEEIEGLPIVPGYWNVTHIETPNELLMDGNALTTDRVYEIMHMLKIWVPYLDGASLDSTEREKLKLKLVQLEATEKKAVDILKLESEKTRIFLIGDVELQDEVLQLQTAYEEIEAEYSQAQESGKLSRRKLNILRDRRVNLKVALLTKQEELKKSETKSDKETSDRLGAEFSAANKATRAFLHWQRIYSMLSVLK